MTTKLWRHTFCLLSRQFLCCTKIIHSLTHQKFRFFTFSRDDALALDKICCSDNVDMLYFQLNISVRSSCFDSYFRHFFEVAEIRWPWVRSFRNSSLAFRKARRIPNTPEWLQMSEPLCNLAISFTVLGFLQNGFQPCDIKFSKRQALKM